MHDALVVSRREAVRDLDSVLDRRPRWQGSVGQPFNENVLTTPSCFSRHFWSNCTPALNS